MKTLKHLFTVLLLLCATAVAAHDFEVDGFYYNILSEEDKTVEVTYYGGTFLDHTNEYLGHETIPATVNYRSETYTVIAIGPQTFGGCEALSGVTIPSTIKRIGSGAFGVNEYGGVDFANVYISDLVAWCEIEFADNVSNPFAFAENLYLNGELITDLVIPDGVQKISSLAFYELECIKSVTIPSSVTSIGEDAFSYCYGLTSVHISDLSAWCNIEFGSYDANPLCYAKNLYVNGELVTELIVPDNVEEIKNYAFVKCASLESITIPSTITSISNRALYDCSRLTSINVVEGNSVYDSRKGCNAIIETATNTLVIGCKNTIIPNDVISIGSYAFYDCSSLTSVAIPNSVTSIGYSAFYNCSGLTSITIPNSVTSIGSYAFYYCSGLTSIEIPGSVTSISNYAFYNCSGLTSVTIGNSVTSIGDHAFYNCTSLSSIVIPNNVTNIKSYAFNNCRNLRIVYNNSSLDIIAGSTSNGYVACYANVVIGKNDDVQGDYVFRTISGVPTLVAYIGNDLEICLPDSYNGKNYAIGEKAFRDSSIKSVIIPNSVTSIGDHAFYDCSGLTSITIPNSVTSIGSYAFYYCSGLTSITIPNSVTSIGSYAFCYCSGLTNATIGNSVTSIGDHAFYCCSGLTSVTIGNSVTSIGDHAFHECSRLNLIYNNSSLYITAGSIANGYVAFYANSVIGKNDEVQGDYVFRTISGVPTLVAYIGNDLEICLPDSYNGKNYAIGERVFKGTSITSIIIPNSVTSIGNNAFKNCNNLKIIYNNSSLNIALGESDNGYIAYNARAVIKNDDNIQGDYVFRIIENHPTLVAYLGSSTDITLPSNYYGGVYSIGEYLFGNYNELKKIFIPNGVVGIGNNAFYNCKGISTITIPSSITNIGNNAFYGCTRLLIVENFSELSFVKGSSEYGYVAYYANNVVNAPNGTIEGDFTFAIINNANTLVKCNAVGNNLEDWTSTNKTSESSSSKTYIISAKEGETLSFDWKVSSESGYDELYIIMNGSTLINASGEKNGHYEYIFPSEGEYTLVARYSKDDGVNKGDDCGKIYNIFYSGGITVDVILPSEYRGGDYVIGSEVFKNTNVGTIIIPTNVSAIGERAFYGCNGLTSITSDISAEDLFVPGADAFTGVDKNICTLYVPYGAKETYAATAGWSDFTNIVEIIHTDVTVTINKYGSATYCSPYALDFSNVEGLKAYAATGYKSNSQVVTLTRVQTAEAGVGLFLKGEPGEYVVPVIESTDEHSLNMFVGTLEQTVVNSTIGAMSNYKFTITDGDEAPMFYPFEDNTTFSAGKAYLQIPTAWLPATAQKSVSIRFDEGETTDIDEVKGESGEVKTIYDLQGRVVENPTSGIYIIDGKKVIIK